MRIILLIMIGLSLLQADFTKTGNIIKDSASKLEWQDDTVGSTMTWESAITKCENLNLDGYSDWRLPNLNELKSIVDKLKYDPAIADGFENIPRYDSRSHNYYWSSTTYNGDKYYAWFLYSQGGGAFYMKKSDNNYVRCVRDGQ